MDPNCQTSLEKEAMEYLNKHKIVELFQNMMASLVFNRPKKPKLFLAKYLYDLNRAMITKDRVSCLVDLSNIESLFSLLDPTSKGYISVAQYRQAMKTLGIKHYEDVGSDRNQVDSEFFRKHIEKGLIETWSTFSP